MKLSYYKAINKLRKCIARRVAQLRHKTNIPFLIAPSGYYKITNPKRLLIYLVTSIIISNIYDLKEDPNVIPLPSTTIYFFLDSICLYHTPNYPHLPFTELEIIQVINTLPMAKSPGLMVTLMNIIEHFFQPWSGGFYKREASPRWN